ncbi:F0F1 ATP synthase subunit gamma [Ferruginivarius sediminum]|uniref:F0F1 ATP synthase subunit gamma n=1 Tax=Ferruginivarius sediminum TaxID=2661937 RepID=A0A369TDK9_9PROT|nr:F0F1 ATP synthase subunit gamma [Ferruginivarius sediminum]RDD62247.1 F0F1 ATP synthase subunit gamma [Ferruginivarius sediminum]
MQTLEALRRQIETTDDLHGIVSTMKSLAAVSIRQYERAADALEDYADTVQAGLQAVLRQRAVMPEEQTGGDGRAGVVVFGSDHGLCGRFNEEAVRFARENLPEAGVDLASARRLAVGARAADRLSAADLPVEAWLELPGSVNALVETAYAVIGRVQVWRDEGVGTVMLVHNRRGRQTPAVPAMHQMLPMLPEWLRRLRDEPWPSRSLPQFRTEPETLFAGLVRQHLVVTVFRATAESLASEHASRLASMQAAERNIEDHLEELRAAYRHSRQQSITEELLDIVSGFEALGKEDARS